MGGAKKSPGRYTANGLIWKKVFGGADGGRGLGRTPTCSRMVFLFLVSLTADSCMSPIFFIFSSMSIFCSSFLVSARSRRTVSSRWCCRATAAAQAEWIAVIQFSSSVWLDVWRGREQVWFRKDTQRTRRKHNSERRWLYTQRVKRVGRGCGRD